MVDISRLSRLVNGIQRQVDLSSNTLVLDNVKLKLGTAFEVSFSGTPTANRTISMPDANVDLGQIATNKIHVDGDGSDHADVADLATLSGVAANSVNFGVFTGNTLSDTETSKSALQSLETAIEANTNLVNNLEWQDSALDFVADNTIVPASEVSGDRYILSDAGGAPHANWDGASAGDIVEFDGSVWVAISPTTGMFISADDESTLLYYWGGSAWVQKAFESTTASTGLTKVGFDIRLDSSSAGAGLGFSSGVLSVNVDDASIEIATDTIQVKADGIDESHIRLSNNAFLNARNAADDGDINIVKVNASDEVEFALLPRLTSNITPSADTDLSTKKYVDDQLALQDDASEITYTPAVLADWNSSADPGDVNDGLDQLAERIKDVEGGSSGVVESLIAGETLTAGNRVVRFGVLDLDAPETSGRVYLADPTELSLVKSGGNKDPFHAIGICVAAGETAGNSISITKMGPITMTAHGFAVGEPVWLDSVGAMTSTAPSSSGEAAVKIGMAKDANVVEVLIQIMGVV